MTAAPTATTHHYAIVLAAGTSTRMGRCKASLPWLDGTTLLSYQVEQLHQAGINAIVVLGTHNRDRQYDCPPQCQIAINANAHEGKTRSILVGLEHLPSEFRSVTIVAVDQPRPSWIYTTLLTAHTSSDTTQITAPVFQKKMGHPLIFARTMQCHLRQIREETLGLRQIMQTFAPQVQYVPFTTPIVLADLNTNDRYQSLLSYLQKAPKT